MKLYATVPIIGIFTKNLHLHLSDMNHDIVRGKLNKSLKPQNPAQPWSLKGFFGGSGHNTQSYLAKPESLVVPSRPPPAERTAEDQPFFHEPRNPEDPRTRVNIISGSASLTASQLINQEAMSRILFYSTVCQMR